MSDDESQNQIRHCNGCDEDVLPTAVDVLHDGPFTQVHWRCPNCGWIDQRTAKNARGLGADFGIDDLPEPPEHPMCKPRCSWTPVFADGGENDE